MAQYQNSINGANPSSWTPFTTTITADTTNPTIGSTSTITSYYWLTGKMLSIQLSFTADGTGTNGSGTYLFNLPAGYTINTTVCPSIIGSPLGGFGPCFLWLNGGNYGIGNAFNYNGTLYYIILYATSITAPNAYSSGWYGMSSAFNLTANLNIPIN
jgi:hypothetical protein